MKLSLYYTTTQILLAGLILWSDLSHLALWVDGSKLDSGGTVPVVWRNAFSNGWNIHKSTLGKSKEIIDAELWGISDALG